MTFRIRRDRIPFTCPNCSTKVWSRPSNRLVCGQCFIPLERQIPAGYPTEIEKPRPNPTTVKPSELPLEQLALPPHVRHLLDSITEPAPAAPDEVAVVRQPEQEQAPKRKAGLTEAVKAEADRIIRACLKADAENKVKRSGWKVKLAQKLDRHPAWVSNRIRKVQAEDQGVAA